MGQAGLRWTVLLAGLAAMIGIAEPAAARQRMAFTPGRHGAEVLPAASHTPRFASRPGRAVASAGRPNGKRMSAGEEPDAAPRPGAGFKMEDGVLTYPAPARFQPKNLKPL